MPKTKKTEKDKKIIPFTGSSNFVEESAAGQQESQIVTYINKITNNIDQDRELAKDLLTQVSSALSLSFHDAVTPKEANTFPGSPVQNYEAAVSSATKCIEALQRSNEQLVKIVAILRKNAGDLDFTCFSDEEKGQLMDTISKDSDGSPAVFGDHE